MSRGVAGGVDAAAPRRGGVHAALSSRSAFDNLDAPRRPEGKEAYLTRSKIRPLTDEEEARIQAGIAPDPDNPEWTAEDFARAKPFAEVFPELAASIQRARGRQRLQETKEAVTLSLSPSTVARFKAMGGDWRARIVKRLED